MSRIFNQQYFDKLDEIENSGEDYNRFYAIEELLKLNMDKEDSKKFCDELESKWEMQLDYLRENGKKT
tara:strand:+ start:4026 stop:4229 length:204 start_codon:yes stop_codon:yes gene_type:complete